MSSPTDGHIKKRVGSARGDAPRERLDQLWQLYLFWRSTPAGRREQEIPLMYAKLFEKLLSGSVEFLILEGAAVSLRGFPRMTTDIHILLKNSPEKICRIVSVAAQWETAAAQASLMTISRDRAA